ncbi:hypothetical protein F4780DRAFT_724524 [Xylariomycetidae sp. FL0641]|nr:hypothetical protein F4780DRAFT_724524 [Xylariomycetidae sp. FL0641]
MTGIRVARCIQASPLYPYLTDFVRRLYFLTLFHQLGGLVTRLERMRPSVWFPLLLAGIAPQLSSASPTTKPKTQTERPASPSPRSDPPTNARPMPSLGNVSTLPPQCAILCQTEAAPIDMSSGAMPSPEAMCHPDPQLQDKVMACVAAKCTVFEALQAQKFVAELCNFPKTDKSALILGCVWGFEVFGILGLALRLASIFIIDGRKFGWDDLAVILVLCANIGAGVAVTISTVVYGYGKDIWVLTPDQIRNCFMYSILVTPIYIFSVGLLKIALILFYLRVFDAQSGNRWFRCLCWIMLGITAMYSCIHIVTSMLNCQPVSYAWTFWDGQHEGVCGNRSADGFSHAVTNAAVDLILFLLPIPKLLSLNMSLRKKLILIAMFGFGLITFVCSIIRMVDLGTDGLKKRTNFTADTVGFTIWTIAECKFGLFCACIPMMGQALYRMMPGVFGSLATTAKGSSANTSEHSSKSKRPNMWSSHDAVELEDESGQSRAKHARNMASLQLKWIDEYSDAGDGKDDMAIEQYDAESTQRLRISRDNRSASSTGDTGYTEWQRPGLRTGVPESSQEIMYVGLTAAPASYRQ